jgi:hypothetical protein
MGVVRAKNPDGRGYLSTADSVPFARPMTAAIDGSVRTDWAGITKANFECCAISTLDRVTVGCKRRAH